LFEAMIVRPGSLIAVASSSSAGTPAGQGDIYTIDHRPADREE
jgi:hypothetical protein